MNPEKTYKYNGILKYYAFNPIDNKVIKLLLQKNIIFKYVPEYNFNHIENNSTELDKYFYFDGINYEINPEIINEIVDALKFHVEEAFGDIIFEVSEIKTELFGIVSNEQKLQFLQKKYFDLHSQFKNDPAFLILLKNKEFSGYSNYLDLVADSIDTEILTKYLTGQRFYENEIVHTWIKYNTTKNLIEFISKKNKQLSKKITKNIVDNKTIQSVVKPIVLDTSKKVILLEFLIKNPDFFNNKLSEGKKSLLTSYLIDRCKGNIIQEFQQTKKPIEIQTDKIKKNTLFIENLIKNL